MPVGDEVAERVSLLQRPGVIIPVSTTVAPNPQPLDYTERVQSFFPECRMARITNLLVQAPDNPNIDILFFKINFPSARQGFTLSVNAAKVLTSMTGVLVVPHRYH